MRSFERIIGVLVGGATIFFGYRLFLNTRYETNSEGKVTLPGGASVVLSRVGPGAFFALFGATLVALSFVYGVKIDRIPAKTPAKDSGSAAYHIISYDGMFGVGPRDTSDTASIRAFVRQEIFALNRTIPDALRPSLEKGRRDELDQNIRRIKLTLMAYVWDPRWGDYGRFRQWAEEGAREPLPSEFVKAGELYKAGR